MRYWNRAKRAAISNSQIVREAKRWGAFCEGGNARKKGTLKGCCPYTRDPKRIAWLLGWDYADVEPLEGTQDEARKAPTPPPLKAR